MKYENCRYGTLECPADNYIGAALGAYGEYSQIEADFLCSLLKPGDVVLEAGAHVGTLTVAMAAAVGKKGKIHAFEPQLEVFDALKANIKGLPVRASLAALASSTRTLRFDSNEFNTGGVALGGKGESSVVASPIDELGLERLDLIKADVEGMEVDVLTGARDTIERCRPVIYCENDRPEHSRALFDLLFSMGYRVWRHEPPLFNPANHRGQAVNIWPGFASLNLVAMPEERAIPAHVQTLTEVKPNQWAAVCRFGAVGDNLIAAAVFPDLVRQGNRVEMITSTHAGVVFEQNPWISKLSICEDGDQPGDGGIEWQRWFARRAHEYGGRLFHLSHTIETTLAFVQAQTQFWWPDHMRRHLANKSYLEMGSDVCGGCYAFGPLFYASPAEKRKAATTKAKMGDRVVGWVICGSRFDKVHPHSAMAVARLIRELGVSVVLIGEPASGYEIYKQIVKDVTKHNGDEKGLFAAGPDAGIHPETGKPASDGWPLRRSLSQAQACDLVIGPDTGIMWSVAMESMPKIMLLSHASPENVTKHWVNTLTLTADQSRVSCWPCHRLQDTTDTCRLNADQNGAACITDISVETIVGEARRLLG